MTSDFPTPFRRYEVTIPEAWIDGNKHLNMGYYTVLFDLATDELWAALGIGFAYKKARNLGTFCAEAHIAYEREMLMGEVGYVESRVIDVDDKRIHVTHELFRKHDGLRSAAQEFLFLHVDLSRRRVSPWPDDILPTLRAAKAAHDRLPPPDWLGRKVAMRRKESV